MATEIRDPNYSAENRNHILEINLSQFAFSNKGFVHGTLTFVSSR